MWANDFVSLASFQARRISVSHWSEDFGSGRAISLIPCCLLTPIAEFQLLHLPCHDHFPFVLLFFATRFATKPDSSPSWKKMMPCSSSPFRTAQPRPCAEVISSFPSQVHSTAGSPSLIVIRQSISPL